MTTGAEKLEIGPVEPADFERWHDLRLQAFGSTEAFDPTLYEEFPPERVRAARLDGTLVAVMVTLEFEQTWGGAALPCGGVSGVAVAPEARGRGLARRLLDGLLEDMHARGEVVSTLYPTTATLYRSVGFEVAGQYIQRAIQSNSVPTDSVDSLEWQRIPFDDSRLEAVQRQTARRHTGWLTGSTDQWARWAARWAADKSTNRYAYVGLRDDTPVAVTVYHYAKPEGRNDGALYQLSADVLVAVDPDAWRAVLGFLAQQTTTSTEIRTTVPDPVLAPYLPHLQRSRLLTDWPWMLRLVDVPGAISARPVPTAVSGRVSLAIADDQITSNSGEWMLEVEGGKATLTPGGDGAIDATVQSLAQIYAGADVGTLAASGLLPGADADDLGLLAASFAETPGLQFFF